MGTVEKVRNVENVLRNTQRHSLLSLLSYIPSFSHSQSWTFGSYDEERRF